jgi:hypothetical protein
MPTSTKPAIRIAVAAAALAALGLAAPQASAAGAIAPAADVVSPQADSETREIAAEDPGKVQAMATLCGRGYNLFDADPLPSEQRRLGTLFRYANSHGDGNWRACALFDNNTVGTKYMKLTVCGARNGERRCDKDSGDFSQYAGPVYTGPNWTYPQGATVTAIMKKKWNSDTRLIHAERCAGACN